jgi:hypothetical protein
MDLPDLIGTAGVVTISPPLFVLYVIQFWSRLALPPLTVGLVLNVLFTLMAGVHWASAPMAVGAATAGWLWQQAFREAKPEPDIEIPDWIHDSQAWQRTYEAAYEPSWRPVKRHRTLPQTGRHRRRYIRKRDEQN